MQVNENERRDIQQAINILGEFVARTLPAGCEAVLTMDCDETTLTVTDNEGEEIQGYERGDLVELIEQAIESQVSFEE